MRRKRIAVIAGLVVAACTGGDSGLPSATPVSPDDARHVAPSYSRDGARMSYWAPTSEGAGGWQLWVANADLSAPLALPVTAGESPPPAMWSPDGTRLAALSSDSGAADIVVVSSASGTPRRVTQGAAPNVPLLWHPDGERFTYFARSESGTIQTFAVSMATGATARLLPDEPRQHIAIVSPDGSRIAYLIVDSMSTVWVADSAGRNNRQLTTEGFEYFSPWRNPWSPDGTEILYESRRAGKKSDLWIAPIDGTEPRQLTRDDHDDSRGTWSPDGRWIAFQSDRGGQFDIWVVPSAGGTEHNVSNTPDDEYGGPVWRPNPSPAVSFVTRAQEAGVWALNLADGVERQLTPDSLRVTYFNVSTSGRYVSLVVSRGDGIQDLAVIPMGGGPLRVLLSVRGTLDKPLWSPDDSMILFGSDRAGTPDIWVVDVADGSSRQIVDWPSEERHHRWSGAGTAVFASDRDAQLHDVWRVDPSGGEPVRITTHGAVEIPITRGGLADLFVADWESRTGQAALSRVRPDGSLQTIWDRSIVVPKQLSPAGEWLAALVQQPDGRMRGMLLSTKGGAHRVVLSVGEEPLAWSQDGTRLLYAIQANAAGDLAILNVADSTARRLTITPENEANAAFTPDGNTVVFQRDRTVQRIFTADLAKVLRREP